MSNRRNLRAEIDVPVRYTVVPRVEEPEMIGGARKGRIMYAKAVGIDMCGLLMDVCGLMLGLGMANERKNADAWDAGRRTELTVPSVAIVHVER